MIPSSNLTCRLDIPSFDIVLCSLDCEILKKELITSEAYSMMQVLTMRVLAPSTAFKMRDSDVSGLVMLLNVYSASSISYTFFAVIIDELDSRSIMRSGLLLIVRP